MLSLLTMDSADYVFLGGAALFALGFVVIFAPITAWLNKVGGSSKTIRSSPPESPVVTPKNVEDLK